MLNKVAICGVGLIGGSFALALKAAGDLAKLLATPYPGKGHSVDDHVKETIATIGENMSVRRTASLSVGSGVVASYVHGRVADGVGKIGVIVALDAAGAVKIRGGAARTDVVIDRIGFMS